MDSFNLIKPSLTLAPYVSHYWTLKAAAETQAGDRVIPTGSVSLIFHRAKTLRNEKNNSLQPLAAISGISPAYSDVKSTGNLDMLVVVFHPLGSTPFLHIPTDQFHQAHISVFDTEDQALAELSEQVLDQPSDAGAVELIERFMHSRLQTYRNPYYKRLRETIRTIDHHPQISVSELAGKACLSTRQFNRIFSEQVGANPKEFMRIVRFQRALYTLQSDTQINFAQLSAGCGYYDQAHLIREFHTFSGYTPTEYLAHCTPYSDYFSQP